MSFGNVSSRRTAEPDERTVGERVFADLASAASSTHPDDLPDLVAEHAASIGARNVELYLADLRQQVLIRLSPTARRPRVLPIDGSLAGRAYRTQRPVVAARPGAEGRNLWLPLLAAGDRVGVMGATVDDGDSIVVRRCEALASLAGDLIMVTKVYNDGIHLAQRRQSMDLAAEMRWSTLPPLAFSCAQVSITAILEPAYRIAGDVFDYAVNGDRAHVALMDAMGHGLTASRMANLAVGAYRNSRRNGFDMQETVSAIDGLIYETFGYEAFVTGQIGVLDMRTGRLDMLNAGHPRPLLIRGTNDIGDLPAQPVPPFGFGNVDSSEMAAVSLQPGDRVLLFTDGVVDGRSPEGEPFGRERLAQQFIRALAPDLPEAEALRALVHAILAHQEGTLEDDATLMMIHWKGRP